MSERSVLLRFYYSDATALRVRLETWRRYAESEMPFHDWIFQHVPRLNAPNSAVLDLGAGDGAFSAALRARNKDAFVACVDLSLAMIAACQERLGEVGRTEFVAADAASLPLRDRAVDVVVMIHVAHHLSDLDRCAREVRRVVQSGGTVFLTVAEADRSSGLQSLHYEGITELALPEFLALASPVESAAQRLDRALRRQFETVEQALYRSRLVFAEVQPVMEYYASAMLYRNSMGPDDRRVTSSQWAALYEFVEARVTALIATDGVFTSPGNVVGFLAVA